MAKEEAQAWKTSEAVKTDKISNQVTSDVFSSEKYTDVPLPQSLTTLKMLYDALPAPLPPSWISRKVSHVNCASSVAMPQHHTKTLGSHMKCVCMMTSHGLSRKKLYQIPNTPIYNIPSILNYTITGWSYPGYPDNHYAPMVTAHKSVFMPAKGEEMLTFMFPTDPEWLITKLSTQWSVVY